MTNTDPKVLLGLTTASDLEQQGEIPLDVKLQTDRQLQANQPDKSHMMMN